MRLARGVRAKRPRDEDLSCPCCYRPGVPLCPNFSAADVTLKLAGLRSLMRSHGLGAYLVPSGDAHSSEYVADADKRREWLTGFSGSAGTALITLTEALLWTDGRYFIQAAEQLAGSEWTLMKQGEPGVDDLEEWVRARQRELPGPVGVDPTLISIAYSDDWLAKG